MKFLSLLSAIVVLGSFDVDDFPNSQGFSIDVDVDVVDTRDVKTIVKIQRRRILIVSRITRARPLFE
jgi:hypothetical protein